MTKYVCSNLCMIYFWMPYMSNTGKEKTADLRTDSQTSYLL